MKSLSAGKAHVWKGSCSGLVEPDHTNTIKKNVPVLQSLVEAIDGRAYLWTVNTSTDPVVLPAGLKMGISRSRPLMCGLLPSPRITVSVAVGAVLVQLHCGPQHMVAFASRTLTMSETNYTVTELECLAVVSAVYNVSRPYLHGQHFRIVTDHHSLCWLAHPCDPAGRLAGWPLRLQEYDFSLAYTSGCCHADADCLSHIPSQNGNTDEDNFYNYLAMVSANFLDFGAFK